MRKIFRNLNYGSLALSRGKHFDAHRCEPVAIGYCRESDPEHYRFDNSVRSEFSLFQYTLSGSGFFENCDTGERTRLTAGQEFLVNSPSNTKYWLPRGDEWTFVYILAVGDMLRYHVEEIISEHGNVIGLERNSAPVVQLTDIYRQASLKGMPEPHGGSAALYGFIMSLRRSLNSSSEIPKNIRAALSLIETDFSDPALGVEEMAEAACCSRYHFSRTFKKITGKSPYATLLEKRMEKAFKLIIESELSLKQIAREVGFKDLPYFHRMFKQHYGFTPGSVKNLG